jgi:serine/threonine protein kinase HipA of HipAB toxin-antitoxin module
MNAQYIAQELGLPIEFVEKYYVDFMAMEPEQLRQEATLAKLERENWEITGEILRLEPTGT